MNKKFICCICGKEFEGWGNNPDGAIDHETLEVIKWDSEHVCCDDCNSNEVISGRIMLLKARSTVDTLDFETVEDGLEQLRSLLTNGDITNIEYDFILANWDLLTK